MWLYTNGYGNSYGSFGVDGQRHTIISINMFRQLYLAEREWSDKLYVEPARGIKLYKLSKPNS